MKHAIQRYNVHILVIISGTSVVCFGEDVCVRIALYFVSVKTLWDFAVRSWIYVCLAILVVIAVNGRVVFFRVIYMIFFLGYVICFQVRWTDAIPSHSSILLKSICRCSQSTDSSSCLIISGDISACSYSFFTCVHISARPSNFL